MCTCIFLCLQIRFGLCDCDVVADEPSVLDLVAFSGRGKKTYLHICKDIKPKGSKIFSSSFEKNV